MRERGGVALRSTFAQRVLLVVAVAVLISATCLAAEIGIFGVGVQTAARQIWQPLWAIYSQHKGAFDLVALVIGASVPALAGGLAILRKFYYAEMMLPRRLQELAERDNFAHFAKRAELLAYVQAPFDRRDFLEPLIFSSPWAKIASVFGYINKRNQVRHLASSVSLFEGQISALRHRAQDIEDQKVTAHLLRGHYFEGEAREQAVGSKEWKTAIEAAQSEYILALSVRGNDVEALEGAARQAKNLEDHAKALKLLNRIAAAADSNGQPLIQARALRGMAEIFDSRRTSPGWEEARVRLVAAIDLMDGREAGGHSYRSEMAKIFTLYGAVQTKREKFNAARNALQRSRTLLSHLESEESSAEKLRLDQAMQEWEVASRDKEAPGGE